MNSEVPVGQICAKVVDMASLVESAIASAVLAFVEMDPRIARDVRAQDFKVHQCWMGLEKDCNEILVNITNSNLEKVRFITGVLKIVLDIKRISDEAKNIVERCMELRKAPLVPSATGIPRMSELTQAMLNEAVEAFVNRDPKEAKSLFLLKRQLMEYKADTIGEIANQMEADPPLIRAGIQVALIARSLTKIGEYTTDMALNIAHIFVDNVEEVFGANRYES